MFRRILAIGAVLLGMVSGTWAETNKSAAVLEKELEQAKEESRQAYADFDRAWNVNQPEYYVQAEAMLAERKARIERAKIVVLQQTEGRAIAEEYERAQAALGTVSKSATNAAAIAGKFTVAKKAFDEACVKYTVTEAPEYQAAVANQIEAERNRNAMTVRRKQERPELERLWGTHCRNYAKMEALKKELARVRASGAVTAGGIGSNRLALVKDGQAVSVIVLATNPVVSAQLGAKELQWHVQQMTGTEIPITNETTVIETDRVRLYIGDTKKAAELGMNQAQFTNQEHAIRFMPDGIVFAGKDKDDYRALVYDAEDPSKLANAPDFFDERGSADAVYDFLEHACGVRWLAATRTGNVIPKSKTLMVSGTDERRKASFDMRAVKRVLYEPEICMWKTHTPEWNRYYEAAWPAGSKNPTFQKLWHLYSLRWRNGGVPMDANHSLYEYYTRFCGGVWNDRLAKAKDEKGRQAVLNAKAKVFEGDHPEFFAKGYDREAVPPQLCYTSEALVRQVAQDARDYYAGKILAGYPWSLPHPFVIEPMDNSSFCKCANCRKWINESQVYEGFNNGKDSNYHFQFVNAIAKELKKTHPDKTIITLAYATHAGVPDKVKLDPAVHVQYCLVSSRGGANSTNRPDVRLMDDWFAEAKTSGRELSLWFYNTFPRENYMNAGINGFPGFFAHEFARQLNEVHRKGFKGINHCGWGQDVENYIGFKLMDDVAQDADQLLDEYFNGLYGAAAAPMKQMYLEMEDAWSNPTNRPQAIKGTQELSWKYLGSPERMARWQKLLDEARAMAKAEREQHNIELFDKAIWSYMKAGADTYIKRASNPIPSATVPRVANASGDCAKVNWAEAINPVPSWNRQNSAQSSRRALILLMAYDEQYLYLKFTDPCGDVSRLLNAQSYDTLEIFVANIRAIPFRQFIFYSGEKNRYQAYLQGEVNWRMNVPFTDSHIRYRVCCPDSKTEEMQIAIPLNELTPGGKFLKPGDAFFMNVVRVTPRALSHEDDKTGLGFSVDTLAPFCGLREMDRLAEFTLGK